MSKNKFNILNQSLDQIMSDRFGRYSKYIIQGRALPDVRDGLKPVQRRIIFAMNELGLFNEKSFKKSARIVGEVIGKYHPHGDSSIYEAMVRMAQEWKMNEPLIEMHGNKGSIDDDPAAAMRYTETRLSKIAKELLDGIKKETVSFIPNFDDSEIEPTVLPALVPNLLINGAKGIASGYATEMPPHNLSEVIDAIIATIKSPNIKIDILMKYIKGPDFPTGGEVQGQSGIISAMKTGKGRIVIRSKYRIIKQENENIIEIYEIPYGVVKSRLIREIDEKRFTHNISGILDVKDQTDRNGISIAIELAKDFDPYIILKFLFSKTDMQIYYNYNNVGIVNNAPKVMSIFDLINAYLKHQVKVQKSSISFDLKKNKKRLEIIQGLIKVASRIDEVIDVIRNAKGSKAGVVNDLIEYFDFTHIQASAIAELKLYRLSRTDQNIYIEEEKELSLKINNSKSLLEEKEKFDKYLISKLKNIKNKYGSKRKTILVNEIEKIEVNIENLIKHEDVWIGISKKGYIKRFSNKVGKSNELIKYALKEEDYLIYFNKINTSSKTIIFTNYGRFILIPSHKIIETKWKDIGKYISNYAEINFNEEIVNVFNINCFNKNLNFVFATKKGKVKRVPVIDFKISRFSRASNAIKLDESDKLVSVCVSDNTKQIIIITNASKAVKYPERNITIQGKNATGIKGISLHKNNFVSNMIICSENEFIYLVSNRGGIKKINSSDIKYSSRTTQGKIIFNQLKLHPNIVIDSGVIDNEASILTKINELDTIIISTASINKTTTTEGFSKASKFNVIGSKIINFNSINSSLANISNPKGEKDVFDEAESKINGISIDDILKNI